MQKTLRDWRDDYSFENAVTWHRDVGPALMVAAISWDYLKYFSNVRNSTILASLLPEIRRDIPLLLRLGPVYGDDEGLGNLVRAFQDGCVLLAERGPASTREYWSRICEDAKILEGRADQVCQWRHPHDHVPGIAWLVDSSRWKSSAFGEEFKALLQEATFAPPISHTPLTPT